MAATAINGIRLSKSGAKAGLVVDGGIAAGWRVVRNMDRRGRRAGVGWCRAQRSPTCGVKPIHPSIIEGMAIIE
ncbi:hypothetical protein CF134_01840 [Aeromonas salmonicida]|uniref:Uncharacterized protein n=1 Tax=Aeromonas salmonicida subsp. pectinolytica 34mel TaxID=1324960 RepID=T0QTI9_AERSA|nr:uncharacterized protein Asalp_14160 [Aeromonas salmonicida subsp. pectinolytica 34mel]EQC04879.1 hypothetical protein K931_07733 [Aeromonas salmonicida subsp. pectinolytica 34mel]TNI23678.1 hypothetical protein CF134_01840 [Aeromonas salmonicida]